MKDTPDLNANAKAFFGMLAALGAVFVALVVFGGSC